MFCRYCGAKIADDSRFCTYCGAECQPLPVSPEQNSVAQDADPFGSGASTSATSGTSSTSSAGAFPNLLDGMQPKPAASSFLSGSAESPLDPTADALACSPASDFDRPYSDYLVPNILSILFCCATPLPLFGFGFSLGARSARRQGKLSLALSRAKTAKIMFWVNLVGAFCLLILFYCLGVKVERESEEGKKYEVPRAIKLEPKIDPNDIDIQESIEGVNRYLKRENSPFGSAPSDLVGQRDDGAVQIEIVSESFGDDEEDPGDDVLVEIVSESSGDPSEDDFEFDENDDELELDADEEDDADDVLIEIASESFGDDEEDPDDDVQIEIVSENAGDVPEDEIEFDENDDELESGEDEEDDTDDVQIEIISESADAASDDVEIIFN